MASYETGELVRRSLRPDPSIVGRMECYCPPSLSLRYFQVFEDDL